jgi:hypothetical protein
LLPDYLIRHDLPSAYQQVRAGPGSATSSAAAPTLKLPVRELSRLATKSAGKAGEVTLATAGAAPGDFAVRVEGTWLALAGFPRGAWVVVRALQGLPSPNDTVLMMRGDGRFGATKAPWTIASVRQQPEGGAALVSYGGRPERQYRPEKIPWGALIVLGRVVEVLPPSAER